MSYISYAQNYEDVMLRRALRDVQGGFYIDVGAQDPINDSVTRTFYELGWHGINIEPVAGWHARLVEDRPHDVNLRLALGAAEGEVTLYEIPDTGLSTTEPAFADQHQRAGREAKASTVRVTTLDAVCREHGVTTVHFLKIDVEGAERAVLEGFSFAIRPWIVLVEATLPNSQEPAYAEWEPLLTRRGYRLVYQDGLNRFYLDEAHGERAAAFAAPPNVFDQFVRYPEWRAKVELQQAQDAHRQLAATHTQALEVTEDLRRSVAAWIEVARTRESHIHVVEGRLRDSEQQARDALARYQEAERAALAERHEAERERSRLEQIATRVPELEAERAQLWAERDRLWAERDRLGEQMSQRECDIAWLREAKEREIAGLREALDAVYASHSWRVTRPLRDARRSASLAKARLRALARRLVRPPLALAVSWKPLRLLGRRMLAGRPDLAERVLRLSGHLPPPEPPVAPPAPPLVLTERAQAILQALRGVASGHDTGS